MEIGFATLTALVALVLSGLALYRTHFAPFEPLVVPSDLDFLVHGLTGDADGNDVYVPAAAVKLTIINKGARPGVVAGLRLVFRYPDKIKKPHRDILPAAWLLSEDQAFSADYEYLQGFKQHPAHWAPFAVLPGEAVSQRVVFDSLWHGAIEPGNTEVELELKTEAGKWVRPEGCEWLILIGRSLPWEKYLSESVQFSPKTLRKEGRRGTTLPEDLHDYLRPTDIGLEREDS